MNAEEARRVLIAVQGDRYHALYVLGLTTGARIGELGRRFRPDLDLDRRVMRVQRDPLPHEKREEDLRVRRLGRQDPSSYP